jgi:hypothetical protein
MARAARGLYRRLFRGVYSVAGTPPSWHAEVLAAVLSTPGLAAASHRTAAFLLGMSSIRPDDIEVASVRHERVKRDTLTIHESVDLVETDVVMVQGIPTTDAVRTIVDLGASASYAYVEHCLDTGLRLGMFDLDEVQRCIRRVARSGRNGIGTIRPLVEARAGWRGVTESDLEDLFRSVVAASANLPMPEPQVRISDEAGAFVGRFDFGYRGSGVLIELDSEGFHMDAATFQRDREKQNRAVALGWTVLRFTWRQLKDDPRAVRTVLASAIAQ